MDSTKAMDNVDREEDNKKLRFTGFYGAPDVREKAVTLELLRTLGRNNSLPWLVGGDFNDILFADEKQEKRPEWKLSIELWNFVSWWTLATLDHGLLGKGVKYWKTIYEKDLIGVLLTTHETKGLKNWADMIKAKSGHDVKRLTRRLEFLNGVERSEESLAEIDDVKLHLNMEMDKEE
ncbi:reverse transcriptase [Gossypium australe]|uniref:Reverse transcriptase n=1 Tax=Gossypium australe TaxID=47621 RepID=A0A5B6VZS9_9ROSI|nr:reverse transcriptase [Gossypium australe]